MKLIRFTSKDEFIKYFDRNHEQRMSVERYIGDKHKNDEEWYLDGYCEACKTPTAFKMDWRYAFDDIPNYRERLICENCKLNNRQRFMIACLKKIINQTQQTILTIYIYEEVTLFYKYMFKTFSKQMDIVGSEYLGIDKKRGKRYQGIRHEDALNLSFGDESVDIIVSNDVFEHVPNIHKALTEAFRILTKRGKILFTIPFYIKENKTKKRAFLDNNGNIKMNLPPQYHGNPISKKGSLVFYDFGWDILDICRNAGFKDVFIMGNYSMLYGYVGGGIQYIFVADKS